MLVGSKDATACGKREGRVSHRSCGLSLLAPDEEAGDGEEEDDAAEDPDLEHGVVEGLAVEVAGLEGGHHDRLDRRDHPDDQERLGHELALGHRGPHGAQQLDEDEHEEQPVERDATASSAPSSRCVDQVVGDRAQGDAGAGDEHEADDGVQHALGPLHAPVDEGRSRRGGHEQRRSRLPTHRARTRMPRSPRWPTSHDRWPTPTTTRSPPPSSSGCSRRCSPRWPARSATRRWRPTTCAPTCRCSWTPPTGCRRRRWRRGRRSRWRRSSGSVPKPPARGAGAPARRAASVCWPSSPAAGPATTTSSCCATSSRWGRTSARPRGDARSSPRIARSASP